MAQKAAKRGATFPSHAAAALCLSCVVTVQGELERRQDGTKRLNEDREQTRTGPSSEVEQMLGMQHVPGSIPSMSNSKGSHVEGDQTLESICQSGQTMLGQGSPSGLDSFMKFGKGPYSSMAEHKH